MSASECLMSPGRSSRYFTGMSDSRTSLTILNKWLMVIDLPNATLTIPL